MTGMCRILALALLTAAIAARGQDVPGYAGFDHVEMLVSDVDRSLAFYTTLFGNVAAREPGGERRYLSLGEGFVVLVPGQPRVDHLAVGVRNFDPAPVRRYLQREGIVVRAPVEDAAVWVEDGDGIRTALVRANGWEHLPREPLPRADDAPAPVFRPLRLDEVGLSVTNLEVDALFYARVFGINGELQAGSLWYGFSGWRLRLNQTPVGRDSGVAYVSVLIANTDLDMAADAVFAAGGIIETILPNGFSFWDPDGHRIVVHTTPLL